MRLERCGSTNEIVRWSGVGGGRGELGKNWKSSRCIHGGVQGGLRDRCRTWSRGERGWALGKHFGRFSGDAALVRKAIRVGFKPDWQGARFAIELTYAGGLKGLTDARHRPVIHHRRHARTHVVPLGLGRRYVAQDASPQRVFSHVTVGGVVPRIAGLARARAAPVSPRRFGPQDAVARARDIVVVDVTPERIVARRAIVPDCISSFVKRADVQHTATD